MDKAKELSLGRCWIIFGVILFSGVCASINMMKPSPIFPLLIVELGLSDETIGLMMTSFTIMGIVLAFPASGIMRKIGIKSTLVAVCLFSAAGSIIGALSINAGVMLASRFIEGVGLGMSTVAGPAATSVVMPRKVSGAAMGAYSLWFPIGMVLDMLLVPTIAQALGWRAVWWIAAALCIVCAALLLVVYREPAESGDEADPESSETAGCEIMQLKPDYRSIVILTLAYACFNIVWGGIISSFYPTYLQVDLGLGSQEAGFMAAVPNIFLLVLAPLAGTLSDRLHTRKWILIPACVILAITIPFGFNGTMGGSWAFLVIASVGVAGISASAFALMPELARNPTKVGLAMSFMAFGTNAGMAIGSGIFGGIYVTIGWLSSAMVLLLPLVLLAAALSFLIREKPSQKVSH